jgi:F-type H+-transporting ATPase subunit gamma
MAGGQERVLRRRIKSVNATKKITKAMELIAASQIGKSQARIHANRPFRDGMAKLIVEAASANKSIAAKMLGTPEQPKVITVVCMAGDRGLSGAYNSSVLRATERFLNERRGTGVEVRLVTVGKKAPAYFRFRGFDVYQSFQGFSDKPEFEHARTVAQAIAAPFSSGEVDQVVLVSTAYRSAAVQEVVVNQLLPLPAPEAAEAEGTANRAPKGPEGYTDFEPDIEHLLAELAPKAVEAEIFAALLEGAASFHASQQRAMAAATENAEELARTLTRTMNRARQDAITTEIMEIVGGAEALRPAKGA